MDMILEISDVLFRRHALQRRGHRRDVRLRPVPFKLEVVRLRGRQHLVTCSNALQSLLALVWQLRQHQSLFIMHNAREAMNWNGTLFLSHLQYANNIMLNRPSWPNATVASLAVKSVSMPHIEAEEFPCRSARGARRRSRSWVVSCGRVFSVLLEPSELPSELPSESSELPSEFPSLVCLSFFSWVLVASLVASLAASLAVVVSLLTRLTLLFLLLHFLLRMTP